MDQQVVMRSWLERAEKNVSGGTHAPPLRATRTERPRSCPDTIGQGLKRTGRAT